MIECEVHGLPDIGEGQIAGMGEQDSFDNFILNIVEVGRHNLIAFLPSLPGAWVNSKISAMRAMLGSCGAAASRRVLFSPRCADE
jgi:hypothetical protein